MKTAVIFDLDGTLIESAPDIHAVANAVLALHGLPALSLAQVRGFVGRGVPHLVGCLIEASGGDPALREQMIAEFNARYVDAVSLTVLLPGVRDALAALAAAGHPLGICTNKPVAPTRAVLGHFGLLDMFGAIIGGDSLPTRKPDPAPLHQAHFVLGRGPALFVGDSEVDAETAARAGIGFALYTEGYRRSPTHDLPHDIAFSDFAMLPGIVARWPQH